MGKKIICNGFEIFGLFYKNEGHTFRKYLNIKKNKSSKDKPDLMVIMMNPGGSHPIGINNFKKIPKSFLGKEVLTTPDKTQPNNEGNEKVQF